MDLLLFIAGAGEPIHLQALDLGVKRLPRARSIESIYKPALAFLLKLNAQGLMKLPTP